MRKFATLATVFVLGLLVGALPAAYISSRDEDDLADLLLEAEHAVSRIDAIDSADAPWGIWRGALPFESTGDPSILKRLDLCLVLLPEQSRAFLLEDAQWRELKPGSFRVHRLGPTTVVSSLTAGKTPGGGEWVEAWTLAATKSSAGTLLTSASRVVNNLGQHSTDAQFSFQGQATLEHGSQCG